MLDKKNFYINGEWVKPISNKEIEVINPATEKVCTVISSGNDKDVNKAVLAAKKSFKTWSFSSKEERLELIENL
mgnify:FL=1